MTAVVVAGVAVWGAGKLLAARGHGKATAKERSQWRFVTVNVSPAQVQGDGQLPEPLRDLGASAEIVVRPASGDKGTEIGIRLAGAEPTGAKAAAQRFAGSDPQQTVRKALREAKQLLETGEILSPDRPGTTRKTLTGKPLELAIARAKGEGK